jgi:hypothetical protein
LQVLTGRSWLGLGRVLLCPLLLSAAAAQPMPPASAPPAPVARVTSPAELQSAFRGGAQRIAVQGHLDLSQLEPEATLSPSGALLVSQAQDVVLFVRAPPPPSLSLSLRT